ncbi:MAG TPA: hypothetical protein VLA36_13720 [Longimicrobiales bacterium]|nr:hypothetical protein [Longimicrobiales bacterium]
MEQLIFVGIILLFSMLEAVARKKRETGETGAELPQAKLPERTAEARPPRPPQRTLPSYDQDPSFDDMADAGSQGAARRPASSEGLIPVEVWEEIQAIARGDKAPARSAPPRPRPKAPSPPDREAARVPTRAPRPATAPMSTVARKTRAEPEPEVAGGTAPEHAVHLTHPKFGKPVHDRLTGFDDASRARGLSAEAKAVRSVLRGGGAGLRQAVLLEDILGPPVSLKDDPSAG